MATKTIFEYQDYKKYLSDGIKAKAAKGFGLKSQMARIMGCNSAYVSQVLNAQAQLSLEQAESLNAFLKHSREEAKFFLLLIQLARAGTRPLKMHFEEQIKEALAHRTDLKKRFKVDKQVKPRNQQLYYSSWVYSAVHILLTIPQFQTATAIMQYLQISEEKTRKILQYLVESEFALQDSQGRYQARFDRIYLGRDSEHLPRHHINWRLRAIASIENEVQTDLHFSSVVSISYEDARHIREELISAIERSREIVKKSKEEQLHCVCLDFFSV